MNRFFTKKTVIFILILLVLISGIYYRFFLKNSEPEKINAFKVERKDLKQEFSFSGEIEAEERVVIKPGVGGKLVWLGVQEGDFVKKGQAVASFDKKTLQKNLDKYMNYYMKTRWNFEQVKDDYEDFEVWGISDKEKDRIKRIVEKSQFDLDNSVLDLEIQKIALDNAVLTTPISGYVASLSPKYAGVNVSLADFAIEIVNPETIVFAFYIDQEDVVKISEGAAGEISLDVFDDKVFEGRIYFISLTPTQAETGVTYLAKARFENISPDLMKKLRMGMTGEIVFQGRRLDNVLAVPVAFVESGEDGDFVYLLKDGKTQKVKIVLGEEIDGEVEIISGLREGDIVVLPEK